MPGVNRAGSAAVPVVAFLLALPSGGAAARESAVARNIVTIVAGGDVMLDRGIAEAIGRAGPGRVLRGVAGEFTGADISFCNLESPLAESSGKLDKPIAFKAAPATAGILASAGMDVVSLANNHAVDCGRAGLVETLGALKAAGVRWCGAGRTRSAAEYPAVFRAGGIRVAFVAMTEFPEGARKHYDRPTMALATGEDARRAIGTARGMADLVVASFHWGSEYSPRPTPFQRRMAAQAAEWGADLVLGHHPHVVEGLELIPRAGEGRRPVLVAYSLGNLVFDQRRAATRKGLVVAITAGPEGVREARLVPVMLEGGFPRVAEGGDADAILGEVARLSAELGTVVRGNRIYPGKAVGGK
jgi:poly-gamma-glutamate synthesis protein (capsule biosynthesis protein)